MKTRRYKTLKNNICIILLIALLVLLFSPDSFVQAALTEPSVRLVYFLPSDRPARPDRIEALQQLIKEAQQFYADEMESHGFGRKTFRVETDTDGEPVVHRINGRLEEDYYYEGNSDFKIWEEFYEHFDDLKHIYFIAVDVSYERLNDGTACGLGGIGFISRGGDSRLFARKFSMRHREETSGEEALGGSAILPASGPCFFDDVYTHNHPLRVTTHELLHAFGIVHDFELRQGYDERTVMGGSGHRLAKHNAEWLSVHRFFNTQPIEDRNRRGSIKLLRLWASNQDKIHLRFEVSDPDGLHQGQLLVPKFVSGEPWYRWGAYRLFDYKPLTGKNRTVEFVIDALTADPVDRITVQIIDIKGSITWATLLADIAPLLPSPKVVSISDPNLAAAIRTELDLAPGTAITDQMMRTLTVLSADDRGITNIAGLKYATRLTQLRLGANRIRSYNVLRQLPNLRKLGLWANNIQDLNVLPPMLQLESLDLNWNNISDVSPLSEFTSLKELWLQGNKLADTSTLFQLHNGTFPADEAVKVTQEQDNRGRAYTLLTFQSLDLKVRINPDVKIYKSLNAVQNTQQTGILVEVGPTQRPPMYWIDPNDGTLYRLLGTEVENTAPSVRNATDLAIDMTGGKLYWTERTSDRTGKIRRANLDGTNVQLVKELTSVPHGIALDAADGKIYLTNSWGKVQRLNVDGSNFESNLITGLADLKDIAVDVVNHKVYWTERTGENTGRVRRADLDGSNVELMKALNNIPHGIAVDPSNSKLYLTNSRGKVQRFNLDGSNFEWNFIVDLNSPQGIAVDVAEGNIYWTEKTGIRRANLDGTNIQDVVTGSGFTNIVLGTPIAIDDLVTVASPPADINEDGRINVSDLLLVVTALQGRETANPRADVNADGTVTTADLLLVIENLDDPVSASAPMRAETITSLDKAMLETQLNILLAQTDGSLRYQQAIAFLQTLLATTRPNKTRLLANYPNPFNPETWIPYQLADSSDVQILIYDTKGTVVRHMEFGHQPAGYYTSRNRAAYWDGRNTLGERVASGVYFYQLQVDDLSLLRKMVILK